MKKIVVLPLSIFLTFIFILLLPLLFGENSFISNIITVILSSYIILIALSFFISAITIALGFIIITINNIIRYYKISEN